MKLLKRMALAGLTVALVSSPVSAQKVTYDFDRARDFTQFRSFALKAGEPSDNPLVDRRVDEAICASLTARGLVEVQDNPDVFVVPSRSTETRQQVTSYNTGWPYYGGWYGGWGYGGWGYWGPAWNWGTTYVDVRDLRYDTLVIDIQDAKTGELVWRGTGTRRVHSHWKADDIDKKVQKTVAKIMSNFPPTDD
jgi:hypothetical protein